MDLDLLGKDLVGTMCNN